MGGNRGSSKKAKSKGWRNAPGSSKQSTAPSDEQEGEHILPAGPSLETISSLETVSTAGAEGGMEAGTAKSGPLRRKRKGASGKIFSGLLDRTGLCLCVVYQCAGMNHKTCDICSPRRMAGYQRMENEQYRAEHHEEGAERDIDQYNSLLLNFYMESPCVPEFCPLLITRGMTTIDALKGIALSQKTEDHHRYTVVEHWKDYEAERILEDHELIQDVRREQVRFFNHKFVFLYRTELEKYEYIKNKEDFFVHPKNVRCINYKKQSADPVLIQLLDPFYTETTDILKEPPFVSTGAGGGNVVESSLSIETIREEVREDDLANPIFCGTIYVKQSNKDMTVAEIKKLPEHREKAHWSKKFMLLRNRNLYFVDNHQNMLKCYYVDDEKFEEMSQHADIEQEVQSPVDNQDMSDEPLSEITHEVRQPAASQSSVITIATRQPSRRRGQIPPELQEAGRQMKETFSMLSNVIKRKETEEDECDLYGKILAKKLRKLPEEERQMFMYEIDGMFIRRYRPEKINTPTSSHSSNSSYVYQPLASPSEINIPTRPSTSHSTYSDHQSLHFQPDLDILNRPSSSHCLESHVPNIMSQNVPREVIVPQQTSHSSACPHINILSVETKNPGGQRY